MMICFQKLEGKDGDLVSGLISYLDENLVMIMMGPNDSSLAIIISSVTSVNTVGSM